jgi:carbon starvation protein CstA
LDFAEKGCSFDNPGYFSNVMPLRMVWLTGLWRMIGGGDQVIVNIALVMVADIFSEEERYHTLNLVPASFCLTIVQIKRSPPSAILRNPCRNPRHSTQRLSNDI